MLINEQFKKEIIIGICACVILLITTTILLFHEDVPEVVRLESSDYRNKYGIVTSAWPSLVSPDSKTEQIGAESVFDLVTGCVKRGVDVYIEQDGDMLKMIGAGQTPSAGEITAGDFNSQLHAKNIRNRKYNVEVYGTKEKRNKITITKICLVLPD